MLCEIDLRMHWVKLAIISEGRHEHPACKAEPKATKRYMYNNYTQIHTLSHTYKHTETL
jgi:hypothetical protein